MYDATNTKHLFQRVILQSGIAKQGTLFYNNKEADVAVRKQIMSRIANITMCEGEVVECLKRVGAKDLITAAGALACERGDNQTFGPAYDDKYSCENVDLGQYEVMIGMVENEAGNWANRVPENVTLYDVIKHLFTSNSYFHCAPDRLTNFLDFEYRETSEMDSATAIKRGFVKLLTDYNYVAPAIAFANKVSDAGGEVYVYQFSAEITNMEPGKPDFLEGRPLHGEDQTFLFGLPLILVDFFRNSARNVSANYIRMISNFAHTGDPNNGPTVKPISMAAWTPYESNHMGTYVIAEEMEMKYRYFARTWAVWSEAVSYLMSDDVCKDSKPVKTETPKTTTCSKSCQRMARWEESYKEWKNIDLPKWQERFQQVSQAMDEQDSCDDTE